MCIRDRPNTKIANVLNELGDVSIVPPGNIVIFLVCTSVLSVQYLELMVVYHSQLSL